MTNADRQLIECDWMCIGYRAPHEMQLELLALCRRFDGRVAFREGDVMLLEFGAYRNVLDEALQRLPKAGVTHFWRSGTATISGKANPFGGSQFLRRLVMPQEVRSCYSVCSVPPPSGACSPEPFAFPSREEKDGSPRTISPGGGPFPP